MSAPMPSQIAADAGKDTGLPEREAGADDEDEVADQVEVNEAHMGTGARCWLPG